MARARLHLDLRAVPGVIDKPHAAERNGWRKNRLLTIKLAARGKYTSPEAADICGIACGHLFPWIAAVRGCGVERAQAGGGQTDWLRRPMWS